MVQIDRRGFLGRSLVVAGAAVAGGPLAQALNLRAAAATGGAHVRADQRAPGAYGPLAPKKPTAVGPGADPGLDWLALPEGFQYAVFGLAGTPMSDGNVTPYAHDGMGAYPAPGGRVRLVRNHEVRDDAGIAPPPSPVNAYDAQAGGGNTTVEIAVDAGGVPTLASDFVSLSGTHTNCAGGVTPWGSWISCEETTVGAASGFAREHGYAFEVPSEANGPVAPVPLPALGRFDHEAVCIDPHTGVVYETEDNGDSGFFRFVPQRPRDLSSGKLQMAKVWGQTNYDTRTGQAGRHFPLLIEWVDIDDPDPAGAGSKTVYDQGIAKGGAIFRRLEGCWFAKGAVSFTSTDGGDAGQGQVWEYRPFGPFFGLLRLLYESPDSNTLSFPDNINVTPRGGVLLCEDTSRPPIAQPFSEQYLKGLTRRGEAFDFALNLLDPREWAGACWSPDGQYLFANTQGETRVTANPVLGRTYAIWGPWRRGAL
ncbi:MAG: PhoX family protein [Acidimicrobiia bacterium]